MKTVLASAPAPLIQAASSPRSRITRSEAITTAAAPDDRGQQS